MIKILKANIFWRATHLKRVVELIIVDQFQIAHSTKTSLEALNRVILPANLTVVNTPSKAPIKIGKIPNVQSKSS